MAGTQSFGREQGQASVELLALLPVLALLVVVGWQAALAGQAWWLTRSAAVAGARAHAVGSPVRPAVRAVLPPGLHKRFSVEVAGEDAVQVRVRLHSALGVELGTFTAEAHMQAQR